MKTKRQSQQNLAFLFILFVFLLLSVAMTYYRYVILERFTYFLTEDEIPDRFDVNSY